VRIGRRTQSIARTLASDTYPGAKEGSSEDELEDQVSDSEEFHAVDGDNSTSDKDLPKPSRSLDEVEAFLEADGRVTGTADADSTTAGSEDVKKLARLDKSGDILAVCSLCFSGIRPYAWHHPYGLTCLHLIADLPGGFMQYE